MFVDRGIRDCVEEHPCHSRPSPAPIIAKFVHMADRDLILSTFENKNRPKEPSEAAVANLSPHFRMTVRTDLPPTLKVRRGHLAEVA